MSMFGGLLSNKLQYSLNKKNTKTQPKSLTHKKTTQNNTNEKQIQKPRPKQKRQNVQPKQKQPKMKNEGSKQKQKQKPQNVQTKQQTKKPKKKEIKKLNLTLPTLIKQESIDFKDFDESLEQVLNSTEYKEKELQGLSFDQIINGMKSKGSREEFENIKENFNNSDQLLSLHNNINECNEILLNIETIFTCFDDRLKRLITGMDQLKESNLFQNLEIQNKNNISKKLTTYLDQCSISDDLIRHLNFDQVNVRYIKYVQELESKIVFNSSKQSIPVELSAHTLITKKETKMLLNQLTIIVSKRIYDFFLDLISNFKMQIDELTMNKNKTMLQFLDLVVFLKKYHQNGYQEIKQFYKNSMIKLIYQAIKNEMKLFARSIIGYKNKSFLIGINSDFEYVDLDGDNAKQLKTKITINDYFNERIKNLKDISLESKITPLDPLSNNQKEYFEIIFANLFSKIFGFAEFEYDFIIQFFDDKTFNNLIFKPALKKIEILLERVFPNCYDLTGIILLIKINEKYINDCSGDKYTTIREFLINLNGMLWKAFKKIFELNIQSLKLKIQNIIKQLSLRKKQDDQRRKKRKQIQTNKDHQQFDKSSISTTFITKKYVKIISTLPMIDKREIIKSHLQLLIPEMQKYFKYHSKPFETLKIRTLFLINNYEYILDFLNGEEGANQSLCNEPLIFSKSLQKVYHIYIDQVLKQYFPDLSIFVKKVYDYLFSSKIDQDEHLKRIKLIDPQSIKTILLHFNKSWLKALEKISLEFTNDCQNLLNGKTVLKKTLNTILDYYKKFIKIFKTCDPNNQNNMNLIIKFSLINDEIENICSSFFN
ncbi:suppressor of actin mutations 2/vacuolar protein sorting [Anaeramoeba flamelloides]|uniref:Suppressor of actin mutations 2/vacuolar protein sorting n=1 Tax=Anaeramoeba flamelloides TaxID=1746091 RepID=A0AAV8AEY7_9EUKA|nr:suppressor of actin mutations 2/vacuolar protein sorting [Anaeramoeba flamelloides]